MKQKLIIITTILIFISTAIGATNVQADYQSRPDVASKRSTNANTFFVSIRNMEKPGHVMGLTAEIDANGVETSASNGIDVHMAKNTEWGTAAILAASSYGNITQNTQIGQAKSSTTGNNYGIFQMNDTIGEYVAGISSVTKSAHTDIGKIVLAPERYKDVYTSPVFNNMSPKIGDATKGPYGTDDWMGAQWKLGVGSISKLIMLRGWGAVSSTQNSIFSYNSPMGRSGTSKTFTGVIESTAYENNNGAGQAHANVSSRAVVVCAPGI